MKFLIFALFFISCSQTPPYAPTPTQQKLLDQMNDQQRALYEACNFQPIENAKQWSFCYQIAVREAAALNMPSRPVREAPSAPGTAGRIIEGAAGTALGIGAAKLILGK